MVTKTYLPSYLCGSSEVSESSDTSDSSDSSEISYSGDQNTLFFTKKLFS